MTTARKRKIEAVKQLVYSTGAELNITAAELDFIQQFGFKLKDFNNDKDKAIMFVTPEHEAEAERIMNKLEASSGRSVLMFVISEEDMKL